MAYENLKLGVSPLTNTVFAGHTNKKGNMWMKKVDVTGQFLSCVLEYFESNAINEISADGKVIAELSIKRKASNNNQQANDRH